MAERAVIYCRVSTKEQVQNFSLETQRKASLDYCIRAGWACDVCFSDEGYSAKTTKRLQFLRMLEYCRKNRGRVLHLVVYSLDRFARSAYDHAMIEARLNQVGVDLHSATQPTDDSAAGRVMKNVFSAFAQFDNDIRAERTEAGMREAVRRGRWVWVAPLGFRNNARDRGGPSLIQDPAAGPLMKAAFEEVATARHSASEVLSRLSRRGLRTRNGRIVSLQTFSALLRNPVFAGRIVARKWGICVRGDWEPIVSDDTFYATQAVLDGRRPTLTPYQRNHPDFPLRRFVRCSECGKPLTGGWSRGRSRRYPYYNCYKTGCRRVNVRSETLEELFARLLDEFRLAPEFWRLFDVAVRDVWEKRHGETECDQRRQEKRIHDLRRQKDRLVDRFVAEAETGSETLQQALRERIERLDEEIRTTEFEPRGPGPAEADVESAIRFGRKMSGDPARMWTALSLGGKQRLQQVVFPEGVTFDGEVFRTAPTSSVFEYLRGIQMAKEGLASPTGFEPVLPP